jgi:hypothetical protein
MRDREDAPFISKQTGSLMKLYGIGIRRGEASRELDNTSNAQCANHALSVDRRRATRCLIIILLLAAAGTVRAAPSPSFNDPRELVKWLVENSGRGFIATDSAANANVFSPGLRAELQTSLARSHRLNEPPCGADGDIILDSQESGTPQNLQLLVRPTAPDRQTVMASFDIVGYHRNQRFMTVLLEGSWKIENIIDTNGKSLRRLLACR